MVRPKGFEPLTYGSGGRRSIQLSYGRKNLRRLANAGIDRSNGLPGGIRTPDPRLRRPPLYPAELQAADPLQAPLPKQKPRLGAVRCQAGNRYRGYRGAQTRTGDPLLPKQVRYQTAPRPAKREREV